MLEDEQQTKQKSNKMAPSNINMEATKMHSGDKP
jgi:hypothetical protein